MRKHIDIDYHYDYGDLENPTEDEIEQLQEHALDRAHEMIKEGYYMGELNCMIVRGDEDFEIRGWWGYKLSDQKEDERWI